MARPTPHDFSTSSDVKRQDVQRRLSSAREHDFSSARWPSHAHGKQWGADGLHAGAKGLQRLLQSKGATVAAASSHSRLYQLLAGCGQSMRPPQKLGDLSCATFMDDTSSIQLFAAPPSVAEVVFKMNRAHSFREESLSDGDWTLNAGKTANVIAMRGKERVRPPGDWQTRRDGFEVWSARSSACSVRT